MALVALSGPAFRFNSDYLRAEDVDKKAPERNELFE